jgi:hypothetical protein
MLLTLTLVYPLVATAFFGALAFAARQPIPQMEAVGLASSEMNSSTHAQFPQAQLGHELQTAAV